MPPRRKDTPGCILQSLCTPSPTNHKHSSGSQAPVLHLWAWGLASRPLAPAAACRPGPVQPPPWSDLWHSALPSTAGAPQVPSEQMGNTRVHPVSLSGTLSSWTGSHNALTWRFHLPVPFGAFIRITGLCPGSCHRDTETASSLPRGLPLLLLLNKGKHSETWKHEFTAEQIFVISAYAHSISLRETQQSTWAWSRAPWHTLRPGGSRCDSDGISPILIQAGTGRRLRSPPRSNRQGRKPALAAWPRTDQATSQNVRTVAWTAR